VPASAGSGSRLKPRDTRGVPMFISFGFIVIVVIIVLAVLFLRRR
jgi:hypothetical protein